MRNILDITLDEAIEVASIFYNMDYFDLEIPRKKIINDDEISKEIRFTDGSFCKPKIYFVFEGSDLVVKCGAVAKFYYPNLTETIEVIQKLKQMNFDLSEFGIN